MTIKNGIRAVNRNKTVVQRNGIKTVQPNWNLLKQNSRLLGRHALAIKLVSDFVIFVICVNDFPRGVVSVKIGVIEFGF